MVPATPKLTVFNKRSPPAVTVPATKFVANALVNAAPVLSKVRVVPPVNERVIVAPEKAAVARLLASLSKKLELMSRLLNAVV